jgi:hypothetical protein
MRVLISQDPYRDADLARPWTERGIWPCKWIGCTEAGPVVAYRKRFTLDAATTVRLHVTADERYELFLDGRRVGRGSERGDRANWFYETYDLALAAGAHVLVARVWSLGSGKNFAQETDQAFKEQHIAELGAGAPYAQISVCPGFLCSPQDPSHIALIGTGVAAWEAKRLDGYGFVDPQPAWGTGVNLDLDGSRFPWDFAGGGGEGWKPVKTMHAGSNRQARNEYPNIHLLRPATLPPMLEEERRVGAVRLVAEVPALDNRTLAVRAADHRAAEVGAWAKLLLGGAPLTVPPQTRRRVIVDLENYYCAYPELHVSGGRGSAVRLYWAEGLFNETEFKTKGNRAEIEGKFFHGVGDTFRPDGGEGRVFDTLWWQCGRYLEIVVQAADEPLVIKDLRLRETRYPFEMTASFAASDARLERLIPVAVRALQMCSHETYMDCPYYEQLMYVGDTRLEVLTTYALTPDDRLPRKALTCFAASHLPSGLTQSRYPSRVTQIIPPFSLWFVAMVRDFALWRGDQDFVRGLMPEARAVIDAFLSYRDGAGLVKAPPGWNFMDWVPGWVWGIPPEGHSGVSGLINWQFILVLTMIAEVEEWLGEAELAARFRRLARTQAERSLAAFWDDKRGLLADDLGKSKYSEHTQCLAILGGQLDAKRQARVGEALMHDPDLARTTIYFTHYLFETCRVLGRMDRFFERMSTWFDLEAIDAKTTLEAPEPSRSDCHAWGAHPLYHYFATLLGIRPMGLGFAAVSIAPQLGPLTQVKGRLPHPRGWIEAELHREGGTISGRIVLPDGVQGEFSSGGWSLSLHAGSQTVTASVG